MTRIPFASAPPPKAPARAASGTMRATDIVPLSDGWSFRNASENGSPFLPVAQFPTNVHLDLLHHQLIPDPFFHTNERLVQWVGETDWVYRCSFAAPASDGRAIELVFEGLDTYATVAVNGKEVLKSENMFLPYRVEITDVLQDGEENVLEILFESTFLKGKKIQEQWPDFAWGCWNGDPSRLAVRKAQYHYGWDWGPTLLTCGPWRPVYLEVFTSRIDDLSFTATVDESLKFASISAVAEMVGPADKVVFTLTAPDGESVKTGSAGVTDGKATLKFDVDDPHLWYPSGYGEQPLYTLTAALDGEVDVKNKKLGLRRVLLVQRGLKDADGKSFFFEVNGVSVWCAGVNWIPADNFLPRLKEAHYRRWLDLVKAGRFCMIRVWGGGIYEDNMFYDICDELGIMVWQDFAFGCGNYPALIESFRKSVQHEAVSNVKRLRHHPCIVIYAGNNEDYSYMWSIPGRLGYDSEDTDPESWLKTQFPARYLYEKLLPDVVAAHGNGTVYHRGSPYGSPQRPDGYDLTVGDVHQWNVWHGTQAPYQSYDSLAARFVSEFGMDAFPSVSTIRSYLPKDEKDIHVQSRAVEWHSKADGAEGRLGKYLTENFRFSMSPLPAYVYATQLLQSEALTSAYRGWRRNWKGPGREYTAGAIVWQINDCWPVTSWAIVDYAFRPKPAYHTIRRELASVVVGTKRVKVEKPRDRYTDVFVDVEHRLQIWVSSFLPSIIEGARVSAKAYHAATGEALAGGEFVVQESLTLLENRSTEVADILLPGWNSKILDHNLEVVVKITVEYPSPTDSDASSVTTSTISWPDPLKYVPLSVDPGLKIDHDPHTGKVKVTSQRPVKGLVLEVDEDSEAALPCGEADPTWSDNCFDLVPGDEVVVKVAGAKGRPVKAKWLGMEW